MRILYLVVNNGSDTRVVKEVASLSKKMDVSVVSISPSVQSGFLSEFGVEHIHIEGSFYSLRGFFKFWRTQRRIRQKVSFDYYYIIDEQLYLFAFLFFLRQRVLLDIFDSMFLKYRIPIFFKYILQRFLYFFPYKIIVTDNSRRNLMPDFVKDKLIVVRNVPPWKEYDNYQIDEFTIGFFGTLSVKRGSQFLLQLLSCNIGCKVIAAGWVYDAFTEHLMSNRDDIEYFGILNQESSNRLLNEKCMYNFLYYGDSNLNDIYASPNKLYDSILTGVPVIVNRHTKISDFVREHGIGYIIDKDCDLIEMCQELKSNHLKYKQNLLSMNKRSFIWETEEELLIKAFS